MITYGIVAVGIIGAVLLVATLTSSDDPDQPLDFSADQPDAEQPDAEQPDAAEPLTEDTADAVVTEFVYGSGECPAPDGSDGPQLAFTEPQPLCIDPSGDYVAVLDTSEGEIRIDLDTESVPGTVNNFATLARWGYYDNTLLFRTDPSIAIIQGGSPHTNSPADPGPGYTIRDEPAFTLGASGAPTGPYRYVPGQIVMARSGGVNAGSAQFFFTTGPEASLLDGQGTYVVFGTTDDEGLAILQSIIALHEPGGNLGGAPSRDVTINSVTIEEA
jgi:peptidyl-prolyl cis-trans isomerase B (cyclophilin B)